jgi:hypothetical protein
LRPRHLGRLARVGLAGRPAHAGRDRLGRPFWAYAPGNQYSGSAAIQMISPIAVSAVAMETMSPATSQRVFVITSNVLGSADGVGVASLDLDGVPRATRRLREAPSETHIERGLAAPSLINAQPRSSCAVGGCGGTPRGSCPRRPRSFAFPYRDSNEHSSPVTAGRMSHNSRQSPRPAPVTGIPGRERKSGNLLPEKAAIELPWRQEPVEKSGFAGRSLSCRVWDLCSPQEEVDP